MNPRHRLEAVLPKRLNALVRDLPSAASGDVEAVHRTRVASRRVREALPIFESDPRRLRKARRRTRALTRALGAVRELDVALGLLADRPATSPGQRSALELVRASIGHEREARRQAMLLRLDGIKPDKIVRRVAEAVDELPPGAEARWRQSLSQRLARRVERLRTAVDHAGGLYLPDRLHQVRIAMKKLRYGLELTGDLRFASTTAAVRTLKAAQDTLGGLHDLEVLRAHVNRVREDVPVGQDEVLAGLEALSRELEAECRALHAQFLTFRGRLLKVADRVIALCGRLSLGRQTAPASPEQRDNRRARAAGEK